MRSRVTANDWPTSSDREVIARRAFEKRAQFARTRRVPQLAKRLGFDLPDAFASNRKRLADFFRSEGNRAKGLRETRAVCANAKGAAACEAPWLRSAGCVRE